MRRPAWFAILLVVIAVLVISTASLIDCIGVHAQTEIRCDGKDQTRGTLTYACAAVDNDLLESLGAPIPPQARGKGYQVWLRSGNPEVRAFSVSVTYEMPFVDGVFPTGNYVLVGDSDGVKLWRGTSAQIIGVNPDRAMQSIAVFMIGRPKITAIHMEELRSVSSIDW